MFCALTLYHLIVEGIETFHWTYGLLCLYFGKPHVAFFGAGVGFPNTAHQTVSPVKSFNSFYLLFTWMSKNIHYSDYIIL